MPAWLAVHSPSGGLGASPSSAGSTRLQGYQESVWKESWVGILVVDVRTQPSTAGKNEAQVGD